MHCCMSGESTGRVKGGSTPLANWCSLADVGLFFADMMSEAGWNCKLAT